MSLWLRIPKQTRAVIVRVKRWSETHGAAFDGQRIIVYVNSVYEVSYEWRVDY
jgi:hypothetical protein